MKNLLPAHVDEILNIKHPILHWIEESCMPKIIKAKHLANKHASLNAPPIENGQLDHYTESIYSSFSTAIPEIKVRLVGDLQANFGSITRSSALERNQELNQSKGELIEEIELIELNLPQESSRAPIYLFILGLLLILLVYLGEISYTASALQIITTSYLSSLLLAFGISSSMVVISHWGPTLINKISHTVLRIIAQISLAILIICSFWFLGSLRSAYATITVHAQSNALTFVLVNCLLFLGMFLIAVFLVLPNFAGVKKVFALLKEKRKIAELKNKLKAIEQAIVENKLAMERELSSRLLTIHLAEACQSLLTRLYNQAISEYCSTNFIKRGVRPSCFSDTPKLLDFSPLQLNKNSNENN
ncbi:MAG: hypothetical protein ACOYMA_08530 [Bacteroidia bacterium]